MCASRTLGFGRMNLQLPLVDADTISVPVGLEYHSRLLGPAEEHRLLALVDDSEWLTDIARRVQHFGYKYDYTSRGLDETTRTGSLPDWLASASVADGS